MRKFLCLPGCPCVRHCEERGGLGLWHWHWAEALACGAHTVCRPPALRPRRLILQQESPEDFVIATGITTTVREFCELAFDHLGMPIEWQGAGVEEVS